MKFTGFGAADKTLASKLDSAGSDEDRDQVARDGGFKNADDAEQWLKDRSN